MFKLCDGDPRANLEKNVADRNRLAGEIAGLKAKGANLQALIEAPNALRSQRDGKLRSLAKRLLGGESIDVPDRADINAASRKAEVAALAVAELDDEITAKQAAITELRQRESDLVRYRMIAHIKEDLGPRYKAAVSELRDVIQQIDAAHRSVDLYGLSIVIHENTRKRVDHHFELPDLGVLEHPDYIITSADGAALAPYRKMINEWTK
jgi:hypothetical protein